MPSEFKIVRATYNQQNAIITCYGAEVYSADYPEGEPAEQGRIKIICPIGNHNEPVSQIKQLIQNSLPSSLKLNFVDIPSRNPFAGHVSFSVACVGISQKVLFDMVKKVIQYQAQQSIVTSPPSPDAQFQLPPSRGELPQQGGFPQPPVQLVPSKGFPQQGGVPQQGGFPQPPVQLVPSVAHQNIQYPHFNIPDLQEVRVKASPFEISCKNQEQQKYLQQLVSLNFKNVTVSDYNQPYNGFWRVKLLKDSSNESFVISAFLEQFIKNPLVTPPGKAPDLQGIRIKTTPFEISCQNQEQQKYLQQLISLNFKNVTVSDYKKPYDGFWRIKLTQDLNNERSAIAAFLNQFIKNPPVMPQSSKENLPPVVARPPRHEVVQPPRHEVVQPPRHEVVQPPRHEVVQPPRHEVVQPPRHEVVQAPRHEVVQAPVDMKVPSYINKSPAQIKFEGLLGKLDDKIDDLKKRRDKNQPESAEYKKLNKAVKAAKRLKRNLNTAGEKLFLNPKVEYESFKLTCRTELKKAHKVLDEHRGDSEFLVNLALGLSTLGLGILVKGIVNLLNDQSFLHVHKTKSSQLLDEIEENTQNLPGIEPGKD